MPTAYLTISVTDLLKRLPSTAEKYALLSLTVKFTIAGQLPNAPIYLPVPMFIPPIVVTVEGIVTSESELQPENAAIPIETTPSLISTVSRAVHPPKASSPIVVTPGISIAVRPAQFANAA